MARPTQPVEASAGTLKGTKFTHPAFGNIVAHRVSGGANQMYGSDFVHNSTIRITISTSELERDLSHDWHFPKRQLIEVALTEAQWATFVSSLNVSSGVPCTLLSRETQRVIPAIPPHDKKEQFASEVRTSMMKAMTHIRDAIRELQDGKPSKTHSKNVAEILHMAVMECDQNVPFVEKSFREHMETTVEKAKSEVHGYVLGQVTAAGLKALDAPVTIQAIDYQPGDTE